MPRYHVVFRSMLFLLVGLVAQRAFAWTDVRGERTADDPATWLVLYNINNPDSIAWAAWYQEQRNIPGGNMIGLDAPLGEHVDTYEILQTRLVGPVRDLLDGDEELHGRIMGILLGYGMPGHHTTSPLGGPGGFSVADAFQDMYDDFLPAVEQRGSNLQCPQLVNEVFPPGGRLTKATLAPDRYIIARIDAPTLDMAKALTLRAKEIERPDHYIYSEWGWYDYADPQLSSGEWFWLRDAVESTLLSDVRWRSFDADNESPLADAFRVDTYDLNAWDNGRLSSTQPGSRIFAYNFNSYGATTVRSTTLGGGRFVPNALANGYAAAIGATGEPQFAAPLPKILIASLREGWTLGESFYLANPQNDWMWTLVGDPLLRVPHWFDEFPPASGNLNGDSSIDGLDLVLMIDLLLGKNADPNMLHAADLSGDGAVSDDDLFLMLGPLLYDQELPKPLRGTGDLNGDGRVDSADLLLLTSIQLQPDGTFPLRAVWAADVDHDGAVTLEDIAGFVELAITFPDDAPPP